jgi:hypothetical protein
MTTPVSPQQGAILMGNVLPYLPAASLASNYGVVGDGISDDTAAITGMVAYLAGNGVPTSGGRTLKTPIVFPPGVYKVTSDLTFPSLVQPVFMGYGATILASGSNFTKAVVNLDGCYKGSFYGFNIQGDGTEQTPAALKVDNSTAGYQNTTGVAIRDVIIRNLKYVTGIDLTGTGSRQLDGIQLENILVNGGQAAGAWSNSGNWQNGVACGNGTFANNYNHNGYGVSCAGHYIGYNINTSSITMIGGEPANNNTDWVIVPAGPCTIKGVQTQNCNQHFSLQGFSPIPVSFEDILVKSNFINSPNGYVGTHTGGLLTLRNYMFSNCQVAGSGVYGNCLIHLSNDGSVNRYATLVAENVCAMGVKTACILPVASTGNANILCLNYANYNPSTGNYTLAAGDISSYYTGTAWTTVA